MKAAQTPIGYYWTSLYWLKRKDIGEARPFETALHKTRDGFALHVLSQGLVDRGYRYKGAILNLPDDVRRGRHLVDSEFGLGESDVVVQCTRPPLDDALNDVKRVVDASGSEFERTVFARLRMLFANCDRSEITLSHSLRDKDGRPPNENCSVQYYQENKRQSVHGGRARELNALKSPRSPRDPDFTVGYLVSLANVEPGGFRFLAAFGAGGTETLWLAHMLIDAEYEQYLQAALVAKRDCVWTIPFLVPAEVLFPRMPLGIAEERSSDLRPSIESGAVACWLAPGDPPQ